MPTGKYLGIWMDNATAHVMEFSGENVETRNIVSDLTRETRAQIRTREENQRYDNGKKQKLEYYRRIVDVIKNYKEVLLFGPTDAKAELYRTIQSNTDMIRINVVIRHSEKMQEEESRAFAEEYFSKFRGSSLR